MPFTYNSFQYSEANFDDLFEVVGKDKKEEIWPSPMTKAPTPTEMSKRASDNTNIATKKFEWMFYTEGQATFQ